MVTDKLDQSLPIRSPTEHDKIVADWAATNSVPSVRAFAVYDSWRKQGLSEWTPPVLQQELTNFFLHVRAVEQDAISGAAAFDAQRTAWALEAVKHVALINLAGIAGILTLQSTDKAKASLFWPLALFLAGVVFSVLTFAVAAVFYSKRADLERSRGLAGAKANNWSALVDVHTVYAENYEKLRPHFQACVLIMISAFASTFIGAILLAMIQF